MNAPALMGRMRPVGGWQARGYSSVRIVLGGYALLHFASLIPWGAELFSSVGMLPDGSASPLLHLFPNVLAIWDGPTFVTALLLVLSGSSIALMAGVGDRVAAVALWYGGACLLGRNPLISNPALPYIGWLFLAHASLPRVSLDRGAVRAAFTAGWILLGLSYSYGGWAKLTSPSWLDGTALTRVLENPLARPTALREMVLALPDGLLAVATYGVLALELFFAPLALVPRLRPWLWAAMTSMHLGIIALVDFASLSAGMLVFHLFLFDPAWVPDRFRLRLPRVMRFTAQPAPVP